MRNYLFFVNAEYCYPILRPLQAVIRSRGDRAAWLVSGCSPAPLGPDELLLADVAAAADWRPDAVFSPGDYTPYFLPGAKIQVFHGIARNKRGAASEDDSDHYRIRGWFDLYCTHAEQDTARFEALAGRYGTFHVARTGWPKLDPLFSGRQPYASGSGGDSGGAAGAVPTVFFASTFSPSMTAAPALAELIEGLSASGRFRVIATLHPKMDPAVLRRYQGIRNPNYAWVPPGEDLLAAMSRADVMLCDTSSIMYEFMFLDRPVVTLRTRNPGPWLLDVTSPDEVESALRRALTRPPELLAAAHGLCHELHPFRDGRSSERVMDAVEALLDGRLGPLKKKPLNLMRKFRLRRRFGYWKRAAGPAL